MSVYIHVHVLLSTNTHACYNTYTRSFIICHPSHNVYYASVHRDKWCDWKGEDSAAVLSLCTKFTIATSCTCIFDKDISSIILYNTKT